MQLKSLKRLAFGYLLATAAAMFGAGLIYGSAQTQTNALWRNHIMKLDKSLQAEARQVDQSLRSIYESMRTISFLPAVKSLERNETTLRSDGNETIQQIYNSLNANIALSEIHIYPVDFNPERLDYVTGKPEVPQFRFDHFKSAEETSAAQSTVLGAEGEKPANDKSSLQKSEMDVFRHVVGQVKWFKEHYLNIDSFRGKNVPIIVSEEITTSDNSEYNQTKKESDRAGVVFSVPIYGRGGNLRGVVSTIIRSNSLRALQSDSGYSLTSFFGGYSTNSHVGFSTKGEDWQPSILARQQDQTFYLKAPVFKQDPRGGWQLQRGYSAKEFYNSQEFISIQTFTFRSVLLIFFVTCLVFAQFGLMRYRQMLILYRVSHDALTGLPNRVFLENRIEEAIAAAAKGQKSMLLYLDLDKFKCVNDTLGHHAGDVVLRASAQRMLQSVRASDVVARIGGDEFVILLNGASNHEGAAIVSTRMIGLIKEPIAVEGREVFVGASIGITTIEDPEVSGKELLRHADLALFKSKNNGRGSHSFYEPEMDAALNERRMLEAGLETAAANGELVLHYQPITNIGTGNIECYEALVRWNHPKLGLIGPQRFIPLAEEIECIDSIGHWILEKACHDAVKLPEKSRIAVNLSAVQLRNPTFPLKVMAALNSSKLSAHRLEFEITESVLIEKSNIAVEALGQLRATGVRIVLDDFGVGYSSFTYLKSIQFDSIKVDHSFFSEIDKPEQLAILRAIVALSSNLHLPMTIDGIETLEHLEIARREGCTHAQGFLFAMPQPFELLETHGTKLLTA